ncbi:hypothetical protein M0802_004610 [Mischocyttarus mexicanus]|nr:hypothetical protein M0802_004610 [Mischocyttarus mexicanus]
MSLVRIKRKLSASSFQVCDHSGHICKKAEMIQVGGGAMKFLFSLERLTRSKDLAPTLRKYEKEKEMNSGKERETKTLR